MKYARIVNEIAINVIDVSPENIFPKEMAATFELVPDDVIEYSRRVNGIWYPPSPISQSLKRPPKKRHITRLSFRNRFTPQEKVMIELAAVDDPSKTMQQRQLSASLRVYLADVNAASFIDLERSDTRAGVIALETYGMLAAGRAMIILDTPISKEEEYLSNKK